MLRKLWNRFGPRRETPLERDGKLFIQLARRREQSMRKRELAIAMKSYLSVSDMVEDMFNKETADKLKRRIAAHSDAKDLVIRRVKLDYTQKEIADCLGWKQSRIEKLEYASNKTLAGKASEFWKQYKDKLSELEEAIAE